MLSLRLFGGASLKREEGPLAGPATQRHRLALLALLAVSHPGALAREKLMACLWPERDTEHARKLLNQAVHALRRALGAEAILSAGDELLLDPGLLSCDVIAFEAALTAGEPEQAVTLYAGPFLDGFFLPNAPEFEQWAETERERFGRAYARALEELAERATAAGDHAAAAEWWQVRAALDPYDSRVALCLMQALEGSGNRAGALQQAAVHQRLLREAFGVEPDPEVAALAERLRTEPGVRGEFQAEHAEKPHVSAITDASVRVVRLRPAGSDATDARPVSAQISEATVIESDRSLRAQPKQARKVRLARVSPWHTVLAVVGIAALALALGGFWLRREAGPALNPQRVVVAPFENRTGNDSLDPIGSMAADWITQGLAHTAAVDVITVSAALVSARHVRHSMGEAPDIDLIRAFAEETGAGLVISGGYYLLGDSLHFQAQITDARRRSVLRAVEPVSGPANAPTAAIELLRQRTLGALAPLLDARLAARAQVSSQPPSFEAYRAYAEGMELGIERRWGESIEPFERAAALDSSYLLPRLLVAIAHSNLGAYAKADSIAQELNHSRERLAPYDRALLDLLMAWSRFDRLGAYAAAKRAAGIAPGSLPHVQWAVEAVRLNRPREALDVLAQIDPMRGEVRGWFFYWRSLAEAHHMLGNHRRELRAARRARALYPDDPAYLMLELRAVAALGRMPEVERLINQRLSFPERSSPVAGALMLWTAHELRVHDRAAAAREMYARAIAWYRARPSEEQRRYRHELGDAHRFVDEWNEAEALYRQLTAEEPENIDHQGALGIIAAGRGNHAEAARIATWLATRDGPYLGGKHTYWRACIAAQLAQPAQAVALLQEAFSEGFWYGFHPHADPCLDPLRGYPPFEEFMRPKG